MILLSGCHSTAVDCPSFPQPTQGIYFEICEGFVSPDDCAKDKPKTFEWLQRLKKLSDIEDL